MPDNKPKPPIIGFCAYSGTGKTTLLTQLIPLLKTKRLKVTVIKHGHHTVELDTPGKDTYQMREAGANQVILASKRRLALLLECEAQAEASLEDALKLVNPHCADLILVEGFKREAIPKIEIHRPALGKPLLFPDDPLIIALASDQTLDLSEYEHAPTQLDLNQLSSIADFIEQQILGAASQA